MCKELVLVTGAGGFIALHVIDRFIKEGYTVRGTVRNLNDKAKVDSLRKIAPENKLQLVQIDLLDDPTKWAQVMKGVSIVMHLASPFPNTTPDDENELIRPAVNGTLNVLKAAFNEKVKRVVLTSSCINIIGYKPEARLYSDTDWADPNTCLAYGKSKILAEKAAWDFVESQKKSGQKVFDFVVINPSFVLGPTLHGQSVSVGTSENTILNLLNGKVDKIPNSWIPICDVRDVAQAHYKGAFSKNALGRRHPILSQKEAVSMQSIAGILHDEFASKGYKIPTDTSLIMPSPGYSIDNSRMINELGIQPTPLKKCVIDMANSLINAGHAKKQ